MSFVNALPAEMRDDYKKLVVSILEWSEAGRKMAELMAPGIIDEWNKAKADEAKGKKVKVKRPPPPANYYKLFQGKVLKSLNQYGKQRTGFNVNHSAMKVGAEFYRTQLKQVFDTLEASRPSNKPITDVFNEYWDKNPADAKQIYQLTEAGRLCLKTVKQGYKPPSNEDFHTPTAQSQEEISDGDGAQDQPNMEMYETLKAQMALMEQMMSGKKEKTSATKRKTPDLRVTRAVVKKRATR